MNGRNKILVVGNFAFPSGNAAGKRVLGLGYLLNEIGYDVFFAGCNLARKEDDILKTKNNYENFEYYCFHGNRGIKQICDVRGTFNEFKKVIEEIGINDTYMVVVYGSPVLAAWINKIIRFCRHNNIYVLFDCVDWIEKSGFDSKLKNLIKFIDTNYMKRVLACRCDGVIAISKYLYTY